MKRNIFVTAAALLLAATLTLTAGAAGAVSANYDNNYSYSYYMTTPGANSGLPSCSYLYEEGGAFTRVECIGEQVVVERYDADGTLTASQILEKELPIFGGFYAGSQWNYLIFGQMNDAEDDQAEVIRVVQYTKDFQRVGDFRLRGANTTEPFRSGNVSCTEADGLLVIRTSHAMYTTPSDGLRHQANLTLAVRQTDMTLAASQTAVASLREGYVSHSFRQLVLTDSSGNLVTVDHGDAYPRSLVLLRYDGSSLSGQKQAATVQAIPGAIGDNATGLSLGGLAETDSAYVVAYNYDGRGDNTAARNVYLGLVNRQTLAVETVRLTDYAPGSQFGASVPYLVELDDRVLILWNETKRGDSLDTLCWAYLENGTVGEVHRDENTGAMLSDCQPIAFAGGALWYTTYDSAPVFYRLDEEGVCVLGKEAETPDPDTGKDPEDGSGEEEDGAIRLESVALSGSRWMDVPKAAYGQSSTSSLELEAYIYFSDGSREALMPGKTVSCEDVELTPTWYLVDSAPTGVSLTGNILTVTNETPNCNVRVGVSLGEMKAEREISIQRDSSRITGVVITRDGAVLDGDSITIPSEGTLSVEYGAVVYDQYGCPMDEVVHWYQNGKFAKNTVSVSAADEPGTMTLTVLCNRAASTRAEITLTLLAAQEPELPETPLVPVVTLEDLTAVCTGEPVSIGAARVTLEDGAIYDGPILYTYYRDAACQQPLEGAPVEAGVYFVKAFVPAFEGYAAAESEPARLELLPAEVTEPDPEDPTDTGNPPTEPEGPTDTGNPPTEQEDPSNTGSKPGDTANPDVQLPQTGGTTFLDVAADAWYREAVAYTAGRGLMVGVGGGRFDPDAEVTRGMAVQLLYNLEGRPAAGGSAFADVAADAWYADATAWAAAEGITAGTDSNHFSPDDPVTREQLAAMLWRYAVWKGCRLAEPAGLEAFADGDCVSAYAAEAMGWSVAEGLFAGTNRGELLPQANASRAEAAAVLMRFCRTFGF